MAGRRLDADERALWARVIASVRPIARSPRPKLEPASPAPAPGVRVPAARPAARGAPAAPRPGRPAAGKPVPSRPQVGETLDGGWDRRLRRGAVAPDLVVDLHGHTLASAHAELDRSLQRAIAAGARLVLLVTGKARPRPADGDMRGRGAIRASVHDWLAASPHAAAIAAVRSAHPRHGGGGALYIILRRTKTSPRQD